MFGTPMYYSPSFTPNQIAALQRGGFGFDDIKRWGQKINAWGQKYRPATVARQVLDTTGLASAVNALPVGSMVNRAIDYGIQNGWGNFDATLKQVVRNEMRKQSGGRRRTGRYVKKSGPKRKKYHQKNN